MRKSNRKVDIIIIAVIALIVIVSAIAVMMPKPEEAPEQPAQNPVSALTAADYNGKVIGILTGGSFEQLTFDLFPKSEYVYYDTFADLGLALSKGKIDAFIGDEPILKEMCRDNKSLSYLPEPVSKDSYYFLFSKKSEAVPKAVEQMNEMLAKYKSDGTLEKLAEIWFGTEENLKTVDKSGLDGRNGSLKIGTYSGAGAFSYIKDNELAGLSIDLAYRFAREYGYELEIDDTSVAGLLTGVGSGTYDFIAGAISMTEERKESGIYSEPYYESDIKLAVRAEDLISGNTGSAVTRSTPLSYFNGKKIGILTGSAYEPTAMKLFPDSKYEYFDVSSDLALATVKGKIDGYLMSSDQAETMIAANPTLFCLGEKAEETPFAFAFPKTDKGAALRDKVNEFIAKISADGTMDKLLDKWTSGDIEQSVDLTGFTGEKGTLSIACDGTTPPWEFTYEGKLTGYEIELVAMFCREYGYTPKFDTMTFSAVIPGISSGKYDMAAANISVTPERAESVYFSEKESGSAVVFVTCAESASPNTGAAVEDRPFSYYANNKKIGAITGGLYEIMIRERFPEAEILQYNNQPDMAVALGAGVIDAFTCPESSAKDFMKADPSLTYLNEVFTEIPYGFAFQKSGDKEYLRDQMNEFLQKLHSDGTYDELVSKWFGEDDSVKDVDLSGLTGENGAVRYITAPTMQPFSYIANGNNTGFEVEIVARFCREYGYSLTIDNGEFASLIPGITSGMYDIASGTIMITEERAESVNFSDVYYTANAVAVVRREDGNGEAGKKPKYSSVEELKVPGKKIGVLTSTSAMFQVEKELPDAEIYQYSDAFSAYNAVANGMLDAYVYDRKQLELALENGVKGVVILDENLGEDAEVAIGLPKEPAVPDLKKRINEFLAEIKSSGVNDDALKRWTVDRNYEMPDIPKAENPSFTLRVGTTGIVEPYSFYKDNELTGYDIEMSKRLAAYLNADVEFKIYDYTSIVMALQSGDIDCVLANLHKTNERAEVIDFSDPMFVLQDAVLVAAVDETTPETNAFTDFLNSIALSFEKNFIRENRWELILEGICTTIIITVFSTIFGSILAFLICMFRRTGSRLANSISNIYVKLLQGTPMVVLLMILYYVILGKSGLPAAWVAIVGFSLNFGAYASEIMRSGIESIDAGQREAALALGYSENQAFFRFIFPQAAVRFLPVYNGEIISLLKGTSIVGYIAIQDLTKMGDIIRSRTYEAFFPLIATAIIYFILAWMISLILKFILKKVSPKRKGGMAK